MISDKNASELGAENIRQVYGIDISNFPDPEIMIGDDNCLDIEFVVSHSDDNFIQFAKRHNCVILTGRMAKDDNCAAYAIMNLIFEPLDLSPAGTNYPSMDEIVDQNEIYRERLQIEDGFNQEEYFDDVYSRYKPFFRKRYEDEQNGDKTKVLIAAPSLEELQSQLRELLANFEIYESYNQQHFFEDVVRLWGKYMGTIIGENAWLAQINLLHKDYETALEEAENYENQAIDILGERLGKCRFLIKAILLWMEDEDVGLELMDNFIGYLESYDNEIKPRLSLFSELDSHPESDIEFEITEESIKALLEEIK